MSYGNEVTSSDLESVRRDAERKIDDLGYDLRRAVENLEGSISDLNGRIGNLRIELDNLWEEIRTVKNP